MSHEHVNLYHHTELETKFDAYQQFIASIRSRILMQQLAIRLTKFPLVDKVTQATITELFEDAEKGFALSSHEDKETITAQLIQETTIRPEDHTTVDQTANQYVCAYMEVVIPLLHLNKNTRFAFVNLQQSVDNLFLGDVEDEVTWWNLPINAESILIQIRKLKDWSKEVMYNKEPLPQKKLLTVGHYFAAGLESYHRQS